MDSATLGFTNTETHSADRCYVPTEFISVELNLTDMETCYKAFADSTTLGG